MKSFFSRFVVILCSGLCAVGAEVAAQALPPGVSPEMVSQLQSMSSKEQEALARRYGVTVPASGKIGSSVNDSSDLGRAGTALSQRGAPKLKHKVWLMPQKLLEVNVMTNPRYFHGSVVEFLISAYQLLPRQMTPQFLSPIAWGLGISW